MHKAGSAAACVADFKSGPKTLLAALALPGCCLGSSLQLLLVPTISSSALQACVNAGIVLTRARVAAGRLHGP